MLSIWEFQLKNNEPLKPVIPLILYHGTEAWDAGSFKSKFPEMGPVIGRYFPDFSYIMANLSAFTEEELKQQMFLNSANRLLTLLFKNFKNQDYLIEKTAELFELIHDYMNEEGKDVFISLLIYFMAIVDEDEQKIASYIRNLETQGVFKFQPICSMEYF